LLFPPEKNYPFKADIFFVERAKTAGGQLVKEAQDTFRGCFGGYFTDLDGYYWKIAWGPMVEFDVNGNRKLSESA